MTQALADRSPGYFPDVLAVEPDRGWLLMRDLDARLLGDQPESMWQLGLDALAGLQQKWLGRTDDLLAVSVIKLIVSLHALVFGSARGALRHHPALPPLCPELRLS